MPNVWIQDHGAVPDDATDNRAAIQAAIDACHAAGGGRVAVPAGRWRTGCIQLRSRVELHLEQGARLTAVDDEAAYPVIAETLNLPRVIRAVVWADGAEDIAITGRGMLDGDGDSELWGEVAAKTFFRPALVFLRGCRGVLLRDVRLHHSRFWTCHLQRCEDVLVQGVDIRTHPRRINADGIDPDGCRAVRILGCTIDSTDDAICLKSTEGDACEDVIVADCVLTSRCAAIKLGTESLGPIRRVQVSNCIVRGANVGLALYMKDGATYEQVSISDVAIECGGQFPILIDISSRWPDKPTVGTIRSVRLSGIACRSPGRMLVRGLPGAAIRDLVLRDLRFTIIGEPDLPTARIPGGAARSAADTSRPDDSPRPFQVLLAEVEDCTIDGLAVVDERAGGAAADRGVLYARACDGVRGTFAHRLRGEPPDGLVRTEGCAGVEVTAR